MLPTRGTTGYSGGDVTLHVSLVAASLFVVAAWSLHGWCVVAARVRARGQHAGFGGDAV